MLPTFSFETAAQINGELKTTEFNGAFCKNIQTSKRLIFFIFSLNVENR